MISSPARLAFMRMSVTSAITYGGRRSILANFLFCLRFAIFNMYCVMLLIKIITYFNVKGQGISITIDKKKHWECI